CDAARCIAGSRSRVDVHRSARAVRVQSLLGLAAGVAITSTEAPMQHRSSEIAESRVRIVYSVELTYDVVSPADFIFNVHAAQTPQQQVSGESFITTPDLRSRVDVDPTFGNRLARLHADPGALNIRYEATVDVSHHMTEPSLLFAVPPTELPAAVLCF